MKTLLKKISFWSLLLPVLLAAASCGEETDPLVFEVNGSTTLTIPAEGGSATVTFTAPAAWATETDADWITISPDSGKAGDVTVTVSARANETGSDRSAKVTVSAEGAENSVTVTVSQPALPAVPVNEMKLSADALSLDPQGGTASLTVTMTESAELHAEIFEDDDEAFTATVTRGDKDNTYIVEVSASGNYTLAKREAVLKVTSDGLTADVALSQDFVPASGQVSVEQIKFGAEGGEANFKIKLNYAWEFTLAALPGWLYVNYETEQAEFEVVVTAEPNESEEAREAKIVFTFAEMLDLTVSVRQEGVEPVAPVEMKVSPLEVALDPEGGYVFVTASLNRPADLKIEVPDDAFFEAEVYGFDEDNCAWPVKVSAVENILGDNLEGTFTLVCEDKTATVTVTQEPLPVVARSSVGWISLPQEGGTASFDIDMNYDWEYSLDAIPEWLYVNYEEGKKKLEVTVEAVENPDIEMRSAVVSFLIGGEVTVEVPVYQEGTNQMPVMTMGVSPKEITLDPKGGKAEISVRLSLEAEVAVVCDQACFPVKVTSDAADPLLWTVTVMADPNWEMKTRTGTITISAQGVTETVSVSQEAVPVEAKASLDNLVIDPDGGRYEYDIVMNHAWDIALQNLPGWLSLSYDSGEETVHVEVNARPNDTAEAREGLITFLVAETLLVETPVFQDIREAEELSMEVSATEVSLAAGGGSETVTVTLNREVAVNAYSSDESAIHASVAPDAANPLLWTVTISAEANLTFKGRKETVTIVAGDKTQTVTVTQKAIGVKAEFSATSVTLNPGGGSASVTVKMNRAWNVTVENVPSWLAYDLSVNGKEAVISLSARKNDTGETRSTTLNVLVGNKSFDLDVVQDAAQDQGSVGGIGGEIGGWEDGGDAGFGKNN